MFATPVSKARATNCHTQDHPPSLIVLLTLFSVMYGVRPPLLLVTTTIMCLLLMIILNLFGFTCCGKNLKFFSASEISKFLLKDNLTKRFVPYKQTRVVNTKPLVPFSNVLASRIVFPAHTPTSKMAQLSENIDTSWKLVSPF